MLWNWNTRFAEMDSLRRQMDALFEQAHHAFAGTSGSFPPVNIYDQPQSVQILAELPGVPRDALDISFVEGGLTLKGERQPPAAVQSEDKVVALRQERRLGRFEKTIQIPVDIDPEGIQARLQAGVLVIDLPKSEKARTRQITVN
ncbi:MAG: Hsp20/alpha crystallin family protein [Candidatus Sericytochromatia bacterium]|nr:Hsp20/alpha crystallin family protein [Candidatus Sericytochromatia bacterium]